MLGFVLIQGPTGERGTAGVVLPKAERIEDIQRIGKPVLPIIETARGFWNVSALAHTSNVERLMFGSIDFQLDLGINGEGEELLYFRSQLVLVSRIAGLPAPVDGITAVFDSADPVRADTQRARRLGFGGKLCIHPKQICDGKGVLRAHARGASLGAPRDRCGGYGGRRRHFTGW